MTVRFYDQPEHGTPVFEETHPPVSIQNGIFELVVGKLSDLGNLDWPQPLYLAVPVGTSPESNPREEVATTELSGEFERALILSGRVAAAAETAQQADLDPEA